MAGASGRASGAGHSLPCAAESGSAPRGAAGGGRAVPEDAAGECRCLQHPAMRDSLAQRREQLPSWQRFGGEQVVMKQRCHSGAGAPGLCSLPHRAACLRAWPWWLHGKQQAGAGMGQRRGKGEKRRWQRAAREGTGAVVPLLVGNMHRAQHRAEDRLSSLACRGQAPFPPVLKTRALSGPCSSPPARRVLPLRVPKPSRRAAVGLQHRVTRGEKGGVGGHCVHAPVGSRLWTSPSWFLTHYYPMRVSEPKSLLLCKSSWISSCWSLFCGPISLHPCVLHCHCPTSLSLLCSCLCCITFPSLCWAGLVPPFMGLQHQPVGHGLQLPDLRVTSSTHFSPLVCSSML